MCSGTLFRELLGNLVFLIGLWAWSYNVQFLTTWVVFAKWSLTWHSCFHSVTITFPTQLGCLYSLLQPLVPANWAVQCSQTWPDLFSPPWLSHPPYCSHLEWPFLPSSTFQSIFVLWSPVQPLLPLWGLAWCPPPEVTSLSSGFVFLLYFSDRNCSLLATSSFPLDHLRAQTMSWVSLYPTVPSKWYNNSKVFVGWKNEDVD